MKQIFKALFVAIILVAFSVSVNAQGSVTTAGNAAARIIAPITLTAGNTLNFGTAFNTGGTVIIGTDGTRTGSCAVLAADPYSAGTFTVAGTTGETYATTFGAASITISDGTNLLTVNGFNHNASGTIVAAPGETFSVGATLTVPAGAVSNSYTGTYSVTVAYN